jgi:hypothetical protein
MSFRDELKLDGATREPTRLEALGEMSFDQLLEDRGLFDRVARALCLARDCSYLEALDWLHEWAGRAAGRVPKGEVTIFDLLGDSASGAVGFDGVARDVIRMEREEAGAKADRSLETITLDSTDPKAGELQVAPDEVDGAGKVQLPESSDRAFLLTDDYTRERAWLRAKELSTAYSKEGGREKFEADYREHIEAGVDFVATLEWAGGAAHAQQVMEEHRALERQEMRESAERERRAEERRLDAEVHERCRGL